MTTDKAIEINDLHKTFRGGFFGGRNIDALRGVSLEVERGSIFGLLGPNGAAATYGPQKGLRPEDLSRLDHESARLALMLCNHCA